MRLAGGGRYRGAMLLRCTARLLKLLGRRAGVLVDAAPGADDWYANVLTIERRKCLLLAHADTLFAVLDTDVRVAQLNDLGLYAATLVVDALATEGLAGTALGPTDPSGVRVAKTASRSVLGHMNELAFEAEHFIAHSGGLGLADVDHVNRRLRRGLHALIDVRDKSHPKLVGQIKNDSDVTYVHTSTLDGTTLFTNPSTWLGSPQPGASHVTVFDVSDPANPVKKAKIASPTSEAGFAHDITLDHRPDGKTLMYAASVHFSDVFDATNPLAPTHLQTIATTDGNVSHDVQPNFDRTMLILTDENLAGQVEPSAAACGKAGSGPASVDVGSVHFHAANPDGTFANEGLTRLGTFYGPPMLAAGYCIAHVIWQAPSENKLTQAYYDAGAWIIDFDDPADAKALGWFKAEEGGTYWANKPHNGYLYASGYGGATGSLDVLRYTGAGWPATAGPAEVQRAARHGVPYVPLAGASAPPAPPKASTERAIGRFAFTARARRVPGRKRARTTLTVTFVKGGKVVGRVRTKRAAGRTTTVKVRGVAEAGV